MPARDYDSTIARMAGNIAAGLIAGDKYPISVICEVSVDLARMIVAEVRRTEAVSGTIQNPEGQ